MQLWLKILPNLVSSSNDEAAQCVGHDITFLQFLQKVIQLQETNGIIDLDTEQACDTG